ncbi:hypothetical protein FQA47_023351 [Oryzias melastigma]|uniref:Uncharacterized protein n=1 Tax=Oryzias melastigma TaxID=30732 RepID=A0A834FB84_ORYME|nr:hypothetical protein FQA47_023351 [Oryzias melastigma]
MRAGGRDELGCVTGRTPTFSARDAQPRVLQRRGGVREAFRGGPAERRWEQGVCCATMNHVRAPPSPERLTLQTNRTRRREDGRARRPITAPLRHGGGANAGRPERGSLLERSIIWKGLNQN